MIKIIFPGDPVAQQRCRLFRRGTRSCVFDPQTMFKRQLKVLAQQQVEEYNRLMHNPPWEMPEYPRVSCWFYMPIPKSMSKAQRILAETEMLKHDKKPDVDNLLKLYLDVLTGIVTKDDNAVQLGGCRKVYSTKPRTIMMVEPTGKMMTNAEMYGR